MAEPTDPTRGVDHAQPSMERAKMILTELACATQSAALTAVDEQKARAAAQVSGVAAAVRAAAHSLELSQQSAAADCVGSAARQIEALADTIRERRWAELASDLEEVASRQPALFVAGAVALGFLVGRFLSAGSRRSDSSSIVARATESTVAAAVSSASGNGELTHWPPSPSEARELP